MRDVPGADDFGVYAIAVQGDGDANHLEPYVLDDDEDPVFSRLCRSTVPGDSRLQRKSFAKHAICIVDGRAAEDSVLDDDPSHVHVFAPRSARENFTRRRQKRWLEHDVVPGRWSIAE